MDESSNPYEAPAELEPRDRPAKKRGVSRTFAWICLFLAALSLKTALGLLRNGDLPIDPAERQGYIVGLFLWPVGLFVAAVYLWSRSRRG